MIAAPNPAPPALRDRFGVCQWFHYQDYRDVERSVAALHDLGVKHLRTGIAWADLHRPGAKKWFDWQMRSSGTVRTTRTSGIFPRTTQTGGSSAR